MKNSINYIKANAAPFLLGVAVTLYVVFLVNKTSDLIIKWKLIDAKEVTQ